MQISPHLKNRKQNSVKYLGIDYGLKKIGVATGDDTTGMAFPYGVVPAGDDAPQRLVALGASEGVEAFVVGLPFPTEMYMSEEQLNVTMAFVTALKGHTDLPVFLVDEQFSSAEARRLQKEYGVQAEEDAVAAQIVLQAHLDEVRRAT